MKFENIVNMLLKIFNVLSIVSICFVVFYLITITFFLFGIHPSSIQFSIPAKITQIENTNSIISSDVESFIGEAKINLNPADNELNLYLLAYSFLLILGALIFILIRFILYKIKKNDLDIGFHNLLISVSVLFGVLKLLSNTMNYVFFKLYLSKKAFIDFEPVFWSSNSFVILLFSIILLIFSILFKKNSKLIYTEKK